MVAKINKLCDTDNKMHEYFAIFVHFVILGKWFWPICRMMPLA